jgi:hypothetical protein
VKKSWNALRHASPTAVSSAKCSKKWPAKRRPQNEPALPDSPVVRAEVILAVLELVRAEVIPVDPELVLAVVIPADQESAQVLVQATPQAPVRAQVPVIQVARA